MASHHALSVSMEEDESLVDNVLDGPQLGYAPNHTASCNSPLRNLHHPRTVLQFAGGIASHFRRCVHAFASQLLSHPLPITIKHRLYGFINARTSFGAKQRGPNLGKLIRFAMAICLALTFISVFVLSSAFSTSNISRTLPSEDDFYRVEEQPWDPLPLLFLHRAREKFMSGGSACIRSHLGDDVFESNPEVRCGSIENWEDIPLDDPIMSKDQNLSNAGLHYSFAEKHSYFLEVLKKRLKIKKTVDIPSRPQSYRNISIFKALSKVSLPSRGSDRKSRIRRGRNDAVPTLRLGLSKDPIQSGTSRLVCGDLDTDNLVTERYCETQNIAIDILKIPEVPARNGTPVPLDLLAPFGTLTATCSLNQTWWFGGKMFGGGAAGWMFRSMDIRKMVEDIQCDAWIETPLFFLSRWDTTNPYQAHHDMLNTFRIYASLGLSVNDVQPVILDSRSVDGPYLGLWGTLFTSSNRVMDIRQLASLAMTKAKTKSSAGGKLCIRKAIWGIHGGISPISRNGAKVDKCHMSPLLQAFSAFVEDRLRNTFLGPKDAGVSVMGPVTSWPKGPSKNRTPLAVLPVDESGIAGPFKHSDVPRRILRVTFAVRNASTPLLPTRESKLMSKVVDGTDGWVDSTRQQPFRVFGRGLGGYKVEESKLSISSEELADPPKPLTRLTANQYELIDHLQKIVSTWQPDPRNLTATEHYVTGASFRAVDFATLPIEAQISIAQDTDVFVGPHGAVFIHLLYLRREPVAGVMELQPPERAHGNEQFRNMAARMGHRYRRMLIGNPVTKASMRDIGEQMRWLLEEVSGLRGKAVTADRMGTAFEVPRIDGHVFPTRQK
ncbi:hypothetical protein HDU67_009636 [Dinochytrium kinnereticum]|nr:hypothetical protein HDU67_009636 [Dinochytrium kinnereticum]